MESDGAHGEGMGDHGEGTHGLLLYDATTRIPLIVRGPGVKAGHLDSSPVSIVDITPTVLAAAGLPVPADLDGRDLGPQLRGEAGPAACSALHASAKSPKRAAGWKRHFMLEPPPRARAR